MKGMPQILFCLPLWCCGVMTVNAQDQAAANKSKGRPIPEAHEVRSNLQQWVLTRQLISRERADWQTQQQTLADLNEVRQRETKQLAAFAKVAAEKIVQVDGKRQKFADEKKNLKKWRSDLKIQIAKLESRLKPLLPLFPAPLKAKVNEAYERLMNPDPQRALQHRTRDLLLVVQAYMDFQQSMTFDTDIRSIDGEDREVKILYMGLTQAWYVDQSGKHSGYGLPSEEGWLWTEEPALATAVNQAIAVQSRQVTPVFVTLPLSNKAASPESK